MNSSSEKRQSPLDCISDIFRKYISRFDAIVFSSAFVLTFLVHMYMFTHKFLNHDDIGGLYSEVNLLSSGRWFLHFATGINGNFSSSWLGALFGAFYLAVAAVLILRMLRIRRFVPAVLTVACLVAFPTVTSTYAYMFCADQYLLALTLSAAAAYMISREKRSLIILGGVVMAFSMGIYQAYFPLAASLLVMSMLIDAINSRYTNFKDFIIVGLKYVAGLAVGMILYFIILRICLKVYNVELVDYQGISSMGVVSFGELIERIRAAYLSFSEFYLTSPVFHSFFKYIVIASFVFDIIALALIIKQRGLYKSVAVIAEIVILLALLPLACGLVYVMAGMLTVHLVMLFPRVLPLILPAVFASNIDFDCAGSGPHSVRASGSVCLVLTCALLLSQFACAYEFLLIDNRAYFDMDLTYENTYAFMTKLTAKIELQEGFTEDTPIALIGKADMGSVIPQSAMTGVFTGNRAANMYTRPQFLSYFLSSSYIYAGDDTIEQIEKSEEFKSMPCYPNEGSIKTIDGVIVVKFSD